MCLPRNTTKRQAIMGRRNRVSYLWYLASSGINFQTTVSVNLIVSYSKLSITFLVQLEIAPLLKVL